MNTRSLSLTASLLALCFTSSCIEFESQEIRYRYDESADALLLTLHYQGVYGKVGGDLRPDGPLSEQQVEQLLSVLNGQRAFFFNNWIFEYDKSSLEETLNSHEQDGEDEFVGEAGKAFLRALLKRTKVENLGFFIDEEGRLNAAQTMRVEQFDDLLSLANRALAAEIRNHEGKMREELEKGSEKAWSKTSIDGLMKACDSGFAFLSRKGNLLRLRIPMAERDFAKVSEEFTAPGASPPTFGSGMGKAWGPLRPGPRRRKSSRSSKNASEATKTTSCATCEGSGPTPFATGKKWRAAWKSSSSLRTDAFA